MATFTSKADGNWNASGQTTWNESGVPGDGDTVTLSHNVTITANVTVGSSPSTGGTPAIQFASVTGKSLTVNAGITLTCKGDFKFANSDTQSQNKLILSAGSTFTFLPPSGQQYKFDCQVNSHIICNGTSGSHVTVKTDKSSSGLAAYTLVGGYTVSGFHTCTYTDFIDFGTTSSFGVQSLRSRGGVNYPDANSHLTMTNCTFTRCNSLGTFGGGGWDGNVSYSACIYTSSIDLDIGGGTIFNAGFDFQVGGTNGVWTIDLCSFEKIGFYTYRSRLKTTNSYIGYYPYCSGSSQSATTDCFQNNLVVFDGSSVVATMPGSMKDCYLVQTQSANNPHFFGYNDITNAVTVDGVVFEATGNGEGLGDCVFPNSGSLGLTVTRCLVLAAGDGLTSGNLVSVEGSGSTVAQTCNHNTMIATGGECGLMRQNHLGGSFAGQIASCRSNLVVSYGTTTGCKAISSSTGTTDGATNAVTNAGFNAFLNPAVNQTCKYNTTTSQATVTGYNRTVISANTPYPNATIGHDDITITADPFVDKTRNLTTWGARQGAGSVSAALALLAANPALIAQADTGLIPWVKAGFQVTGAAGLLLKDSGHDGVTIGALEYVAPSSGGRGMGSRRGHTLLCP